MAQRRVAGKPYRFIVHKNRAIEVIFDSAPSKRVSTGTRDMLEAVLFAEKRMQSEGRGNGSTLFRTFAENFFNRTDEDSFRARLERQDKARKDSSYKGHQIRLDKYVIPYFGDYRIDSITSLMCEKFVEQLPKTLSGAYRCSIYYTLRYVLLDAERHGLIARCPADGDLVGLPKKTPVKTVRALTSYEQSLLFPLDADKRIGLYGGLIYATYFSIMYSTGFRPGEVKGIQVGDLWVGSRGVCVDVTHSVPSDTNMLEDRVKTTGKGFSARTGVLDDIAVELLSRLIRQKQLGPQSPIFRVRQESYICVRTCNLHWRAACTSLGLDEAAKMTEYCIRHTFGTERKGVIDDKTLADYMGHSGGVMLSTYDNRERDQRLAQADAARDKLTSVKPTPIAQPFYEKVMGQ